MLTQPSTRLFFNYFDIPQIAGSAFYAPVLRSWLVASTLINFQQISECKLTQLYSLPDTGKKADKKRYLFTRPTRKWTCSDENMLYPLHPLECKPSRIRLSAFVVLYFHPLKKETIRTHRHLFPSSKKNISAWSSRFSPLYSIYSHPSSFISPTIYHLPSAGPLVRCFLSFFLFEIKGRSTATSYKKKKHSYITRRSEHHHKQHTQQNTIPPQPGRGAKRSHPRTAPLSPTLCHAKCRGPLQARAAARTPPPWDYPPQVAHTRSSIPLFEWSFRRTLTSQRR